MKSINILVIPVMNIVIMCMSCDSQDTSDKFTCKEAETGVGNFFAVEKSVDQKVLTPNDYIYWVRHHLFETRTIDSLNFQLQYKPYDYIACLEIGSDTVKDFERERIVREIEGLEYFDLRIAVGTGKEGLLKYQSEDSLDYEKRLKYYAFGLAKDISLIDGTSDTVHPVLFHFEPAYDATSFCTFSIAFSKDRIRYSGNLIICVYDREFSGKTASFDFPVESLYQLPKLKAI